MKQKTTLHWVTVAACCGIFASSLGICNNSVGVFYTPVSEALGVGRGAFALSATLSAMVSGFSSPLVAKWMGKHSLRPMLLFGILLNGAATALMSLANNIWVFYGLGILRGMGLSCFSLMPVTTVISNWFETRHGLAVGLAMSFSGVSGAVFSPLFSGLIQWVGWRQAYVYMALFSLVLALPGALLLRARPQELGLLPYGASRAAPELSVSFGQKKKQSSVWLTLPFLVLAATALIQNFVTGLAQHFPGYAETVGLTVSVGALMVSAGMVGNIVSKLFIGLLSDKFGPFIACAVMISINCAAMVSLFLLPAGASVLALASAFFYGGIYAVTGVGTSLITRRVFGMERYASAYSGVTITTSVGNALSLTIIGAIYDMTGAYTAAILISIIFDAAALLALWFLSHRARAGSIR